MKQFFQLLERIALALEAQAITNRDWLSINVEWHQEDVLLRKQQQENEQRRLAALYSYTEAVDLIERKAEIVRLEIEFAKLDRIGEEK